MRELALPLDSQLLLRFFARRDVAGHAAHDDRLATAVAIDPAIRGNPTRLSVREHDTIFNFISASSLHHARESSGRTIRDPPGAPFPKCRRVPAAPSFRKAKQISPLLARPDFVSSEIPDPDSKVRGFNGQTSSAARCRAEKLRRAGGGGVAERRNAIKNVSSRAQSRRRENHPAVLLPRRQFPVADDTAGWQ